MANRLIKYEVGHVAGTLITADSGVLTIGDSTPVTTSTSMYGVAADFSGNLFIADSANSCVYKVTESGTVRLYAGTVGAEGSTNGIASVARFKNPHGVAVDKSGNVFVADSGNGSVRMIDLNGNVGTVVTGLTNPWGVACAANGDTYVTDNGAHCVYRIRRGRGALWDAAVPVAGSIGVSGDVSAEYADNARFNAPTGIAVDPSGYVFVADAGNKKIKRIGLDGFVVRYCGTTTGDVIGTYQTSKFTSLGLMTCDKTGDLYVIDSTYANIASSSSSNSVDGDTNYVPGDKIKKIGRNGDTALISMVAGGSAVGIAATPSGVIYITKSAAGTTNSSSSSSTYASLSSSSSSSLSSHH